MQDIETAPGVRLIDSVNPLPPYKKGEPKLAFAVCISD